MMDFETFRKTEGYTEDGISEMAYKNYCDMQSRYRESKSNIEELVKEFKTAAIEKIGISYVISCNNFTYIGNDLKLETMYISSIGSLVIETTSGNQLTIPSDMKIKKCEGIEPFANTKEYKVKNGNFRAGIIFYYE